MHFPSTAGQRASYKLLSFVMKTLLITLGGFTFFRLLLLFLYLRQLGQGIDPALILLSLLRGLGNDLLAVGVLFWLPLLLGALQPVLRGGRTVLLFIGLFLTGLSLHLSLIVSSLDVPFFRHFSTHVTDMFLNWRDQFQFLVRMVVEEYRFWWFIGLFVILSILAWWWIMRRLPQIIGSAGKADRSRAGASWFMVAVLLLLSLVLRSRLIRKHHFSEGETVLTFHPLLDKISQNPLLTLGYALTSPPVGRLLEKRIPLPRAAEKLARVLERPLDLDRTEPMAEQVSAVEELRPWNVVIVLMESINVERMNSGLMPSLLDISRKGKTWTRFFSAGVHTYAGLYATLCSYPVQLRRHALKWDSERPYNGLGTVLRRNGYQTLLFSTHDRRFDNMESFFLKNGFSSVVGVEHYGDRALATFGVPDHVMFRKVVSELNDHDGENPFLAVLLSASNHAPYRLPDRIPFTPRGGTLSEKMIEYSDWALGEFAEMAAEKEWARRTVFVYLGDHGAAGDFRFPLPLSMVHVPLVMVGPGLTPGETSENLASQLDVMPTVLGLLGLEYRNLGFGVDLSRRTRSLAFFCNDEYLGCTDGKRVLCFNFDSPGYGGWLGQPDETDGSLRRRLDEMRETALAHWRMADWLVSGGRQFLPCPQ